jgi:hypothetical protein
MQPHPTRIAPSSPQLSDERRVRGERGRQRVGRALEHRAEAVADDMEHVAAMVRWRLESA